MTHFSFTTILDINEVDQLPPADSRIVYQFYTDADGLCECSSFLSDGSEKDVIRSIDSLKQQAANHGAWVEDYVFVEGFRLQNDGSYSVILGS